MKVRGRLEVLLVSAQLGFKKTDGSTHEIHPYAILTCGLEMKKSKAAKGPNPEWNERFSFDIYHGVRELEIVLKDRDTRWLDDFLGEVTIDLGPVFAEGKIPPTPYKLNPHGLITVGLEFTPAN